MDKIKEIKKKLNELGSNGEYEEYREFLIEVIQRAVAIWESKETPSFIKDDCLNEFDMEFEERFAELFVAMADKLDYQPTTPVDRISKETRPTEKESAPQPEHKSIEGLVEAFEVLLDGFGIEKDPENGKQYIYWMDSTHKNFGKKKNEVALVDRVFFMEKIKKMLTPHLNSRNLLERFYKFANKKYGVSTNLLDYINEFLKKENI